MTAIANDDGVLYVEPGTLDRLIAQQRVGIWDRTGPVRLTFRPDDPHWPAAAVGLADNVAPHAVHRQRWTLFRRKPRPVYDKIAEV